MCLSGCPNGVFDEEGVETGADILGHLEERCRKRRADGRIDLFCHKAIGPAAGARALLPCLGSLSEMHVVGMARLGANLIVFHHGDCSSCKMQKGYELFNRSLAESVELLNLVGCGDTALKSFDSQIVFQIETDIKPPFELAMSRRDLFSLAKNKTLAATGQIAGDLLKLGVAKMPKADSRHRDEMSPRRVKLIGFLARIKGQIADSAPIAHGAATLRHVSIDPLRCDGCCACVALCPNQALAKKISGRDLSLFFEPWRCTDCRFCQDLCHRGAIQIKLLRGQEPADFFRSNLAARLRLASCALCKAKIVENEKGLCSSCSKRFF